MDAHELGRWTRFAARGGIGKCTATQDCVAEGPEDLMFLKARLTFFYFFLMNPRPISYVLTLGRNLL